LTFFPMHFLGMAGMPRRIPEYPVAFRYWNYLSSFGSIVTSLAMIIFVFAIFILLIKNYTPFYIYILNEVKIANRIVKNVTFKIPNKAFDCWYYLMTRKQFYLSGITILENIVVNEKTHVIVIPLFWIKKFTHGDKSWKLNFFALINFDNFYKITELELIQYLNPLKWVTSFCDFIKKKSCTTKNTVEIHDLEVVYNKDAKYIEAFINVWRDYFSMNTLTYDELHLLSEIGPMTKDNQNEWFPFQPPGNRLMQNLIELHQDIMFYLQLIGLGVFFTMLWILLLNTTLHLPNERFNVTQHTFLEVVWTLIPTIILIFIALPSFTLLYSMEDLSKPELTIKVVGKQWYWTYNVEWKKTLLDGIINQSESNISPKLLQTTISNFTFDSYYQNGTDWFKKVTNNTIPQEILSLKENNSPAVITTRVSEVIKNFNLAGLKNPKGQGLPFVHWSKLSVDNILYLPIHKHIMLQILAEDVIHSWAIPALGIKIDAVPGRINLTTLYIDKSATYYGQCSELCGINHAFMPIVLRAVPIDEYALWYTTINPEFNDEIKTELSNIGVKDIPEEKVIETTQEERYDEWEWY
jgi:cytochrome c oxidase subunit 2